MRRSFFVVLFVVWVVGVLAPGVVSAQVDAYHFTGINFNFANPGARARGIGGAFVALADDATAALANPAGLAYLDRQFSLELIHDEERAPVGQLTQGVAVTGERPLRTFTAENDPFRVWAESESDRVNYASFVFPVPSWNVGFALYYASLADLGQDYELGAGLMCLDNGSPYLPGAGGGCQENTGTSGGTYLPQSVSARLETNLLGFGFGWKLGDTFSIGASVAYTETTFTGTSTSHPLEDPLVSSASQTSSVDDQDVMYSIGILYRGKVVGVGLNYRSETQFDIANDLLDGSGDPIPEFDFGGEFRIPERLAAGLALFPGDHWVIAAEYVHLPYSVMPEGMPHQFSSARQSAGVEYASADVDEYHIGAEYTTFSGGKGWSVRAGYWRDQTHLTFSSQGYNDPVENEDDRQLAQAALLYSELELKFDHFTAGFGTAFGAFRVDLAVDYSSDAGTDFLLSGVFYF